MNLENEENSEPNEFHVMMALQCQLLRDLRELKGISICALAKKMNCSRNRLAKMERNEVADGHDTKGDYLNALDVSMRYFNDVMTKVIINYEDHRLEVIKSKRIIALAYSQADSISKNIKYLCRDIVNTTMMLAGLVAVSQCFNLKTNLLVDTIIRPKLKMTSSQKEKNYLEFQESISKCEKPERFLSESNLEELWKNVYKYIGRINRQHKKLAELLAKEGLTNE